MKKGMTVTYEVEDALYVNMTNRCSNRCEFCIRNNGDGAYGSDPLWLEREPTVDETVESILSRDVSAYTELVFCGYGEPTERLDDMLAVIKRVKSVYPTLKVRLNTNGHANLINGEGAAKKMEGLIDSVSISLNTPDPLSYERICHPVYKEKAFPALLDFVREVKNYVQKTLFSVVGDFLTEKELAACRRIADEVGVPLRVRKYISE